MRFNKHFLQTLSPCYADSLKTKQNNPDQDKGGEDNRQIQDKNCYHVWSFGCRTLIVYFNFCEPLHSHGQRFSAFIEIFIEKVLPAILIGGCQNILHISKCMSQQIQIYKSEWYKHEKKVITWHDSHYPLALFLGGEFQILWKLFESFRSKVSQRSLFYCPSEVKLFSFTSEWQAVRCRDICSIPLTVV